jgi:hypothetical protein
MAVPALAEPCVFPPCITGSGIVPGARKFEARMIVPSRSVPSKTPAPPEDAMPGMLPMSWPA